MSEAVWMGQRAHLRRLLVLHPQWTIRQLADAVGCSPRMVCKWKQRFREADPGDFLVLFSRSRARHQRPPGLDQEVIERICEMRQAPPAHLNRVPGPKALVAFLKADELLKASGKRLPRSSKTVWQILDRAELIVREGARQRKPLPAREPLEEVQIDFKDASTVPADPDGKRQHVIEIYNFVDAGTSIPRFMRTFMRKRLWRQ